MASCSSSSSSGSGSRELMRLEELPCGVVRTFKPTDAQLVGHYLYGKIRMMGQVGNGKQAFPELDVYGITGMEPWLIWDCLEAIRFPHQDFSYFFTRVKRLSAKGKGKRCSRTVGSGGKWSENESSKEVYVDGFQEPFGRMRKLRYENSDKEFEHHGAWMIEEFSIEHPGVVSSDLVLCRMKRNGKSNNKKRKAVEDEEVNAKRAKCFQAEKQVISDSHHEQQQQWQLSDVHVQQQQCGDNVVDRAGLEQGSTSAQQQQQIPAPHFDNNYNCTADDVIVSQNESEHAVLEEDTGWWLENIIAWDEDVDPSLYENHSSAADDLTVSVNESTALQLEEEGTDHNGSVSEGAREETLPPALLEQHTSSSPLMSQQQHLTDDDQAFAFACDNDTIPMDGVSCFQFDDSSNFDFHFENQYLSEEATLPVSTSSGDDNGLPRLGF
uniref:uncharacterized protein LOC105351863 n=1 Tax=Fragaria vesca subsp. vesca TaxID=101020 RepID=UPI0005CA4DDE|nr:PREDICTED: uncharacterized protein LOC105351863 [Fragaria vesca subsp. vesca]